jgi:hypothetical protein
MRGRLEHVEAIFPDLAAAGYTPKSEKSGVYNCIAFAAGDESRKWRGYREIGYYWPEGGLWSHCVFHEAQASKRFRDEGDSTAGRQTVQLA